MDTESSNWCRLAQLIMNKGTEVLRKFLLLEILTSFFTKYSTFWRNNVHNPGNVKYSTNLLRKLVLELPSSAKSSKTTLTDLLQSWKKPHRGKNTTLMQEIDRLKQWKNDIPKISINSISIGTLNDWLFEIEQEIQKLNSIYTVLSAWDASFLRHLCSAQLDLLLEIEKNDGFLSRCSDLATLSQLSINEFEQHVQNFKNDLKIWKKKCCGVLRSFKRECNTLIISGLREARGLQECSALVDFLIDFRKEINKGNVKSNADLFCGEWYNDVKRVIDRHKKQTQEGDSKQLAQSLREDLAKFPPFKEKKIKDFFDHTHFSSIRQRLRDKQLSKLKDISGSADLNKFDLTLLIVVLRNNKLVHSQLLDYDEDPYDWDTTVSADILRLKSHRNDIVAHIEQARISIVIFENLWTKITMLLCKIASRCGDKFSMKISTEIDQMKNYPLEPHRISELRQEFITWCKNNIEDELSPEAYRHLDMLQSIQISECNLLRSKQEMGADEIPSTWSTMSPNENLKVVSIQSSDPEYQDVQTKFLQSVGGCRTVLKIERIQNRTLFQQYKVKKKLLEQNNPGNPNESHLWHGTDLAAAESITVHGFNRSYCGKNATAYGEGVYFASNASHAASDTYSRPEPNGNKTVFLCMVLTGKYTLGSPGLRIPPAKSTSNLIDLYDSVVNNVSNPDVFAIFNDTQAYPKYLITFKER